MSVVKVKHCPFCNCMDTEKIKLMEIGNSIAVTCLQCAAIGPINDTEDGALSNWNSRSVVILPQEIIDLLEQEDGENVEED